MIFVIGGTISGIVLGALALLLTSKRAALLGWLVLGFGALALLAILPSFFSIIMSADFGLNPVFSIGLGVACVIAGAGSILLKRSRSWQVWLGLGLGLIPVLFWKVFILAEILFPHA